MESAVGLPYLPGGGDHAAVFVGVGVAEHDFLAMVPGFEQGLVGFGAPEGAADGGRILEIFDGLEEGDRLQARIRIVGAACGSAAALDADSAEAREPEDVENVVGRGGAADDVAWESFGDVVALKLRDGAEGGEDFGGLRRERGRKGEAARVGSARGLRELADGGGVDTSVLADVEGMEVQAVGADFDQEWINVNLREAAATIADEAGTQDGEVLDELGGTGVGRQWGLLRQMDREMR